MNKKIPEILYEDKDLIVCRKEPGIAVETARAGQMDLVSLLKNYRAKSGEKPYIAPVHRLDQPVEGVMVFAKNKKAAGILSGQVQSGTWTKDYLALVCGKPDSPAGKLENYLLRDGRKNISKAVPKGTKGSKKALLIYEMISREACIRMLTPGEEKTDRKPETEKPDGKGKETLRGDAGDAGEVKGKTIAGNEDAGGSQKSVHECETLLRIRLLTGRHHQIRVQLAAAGMPVRADAKYGTAVPGQAIALCAFHLHFTHPGNGRKMDFRIRPEWL